MRRNLRKKPERPLPDWLRAEPTSAAVVRLITRQNAVDPRLMPTDRHMQRWAVGTGSGLPNPDRALMPRSMLSPLPRDEAILTDQIVLESPVYWRRFTFLWYRSDCSVEQLAADLRMSRDKVYIERRLCLSYLLGRLTGAGLHLSTFEPWAL